jgi:hypothetical protein
MLRPLGVRALPGHRLCLRYSDGTEGEVDLSRLVGRGVFTIWNQPGVFEAVTLGPGRSVHWSDEVELCPDSLYLEITGKAPEELFPALRASR